MNYSTLVTSIAVAGLISAFAPSARADECDKLTYLTFSAPVALPGVTLPAGTYRFMHPDCVAGDRLLQVSSEDGSEVYATLQTIPDVRLIPSNRVEVMLAEMPVGSPSAVKAWFYPGETVGDELIYPKRQARVVADASEQAVFASNRTL